MKMSFDIIILMKELIKKLPKAELHLHIEGTLEPELMFRLAKKNDITIPFKSVDEVKRAYSFTSLQSFLDIYYAGAAVLITQEDFFDLTWEYLLRCKEQNIVHTEIMFDPQTHTSRGIEFQTVINGITKALEKAKNELDIKAKKQGYKLVAHAGEEADTSYIWGALNLLHVNRIDHGIRSDEDDKLLEYLKDKKIPLTVCPFSNVKLKAVKDMEHHNILKLLKKGLHVTVNSDDPAYFGGYLNENYEALVESLDMSEEELRTLVDNSFRASFKTTV